MCIEANGNSGKGIKNDLGVMLRKFNKFINSL